VFEHALHEADREFEKAVEELRVQGEHPRRDRAA
jgi:translation elongation factor EF-Ts